MTGDINHAVPPEAVSNGGSTRNPTAVDHGKQRNCLSSIRRLGIYGARNAGKSCYLACLLYGDVIDTETGSTVALNDDKAFADLESTWELLARGKKSAANPVADPTEVNFSLLSNDVKWNLATRDYAGSLVQVNNEGIQEIQEEVRSWIRDCDVLFLFVDSDLERSTEEAKKRLAEVGIFLNLIQQAGPDGNKVDQPVGLILTKWDVGRDQLGTSEEEEENAIKYLETQETLKQISEVTNALGDNVRVFPISAFGGNQDGDLPPADGPSPFNLHSPLVWAVKKADEVLYQRVKDDVDEELSGFTWHRSRKSAIARYRSLIDDAAINKGPVYQQIRTRISSLKWWRHGQRCASLLLLSAIICCALFVIDHRQYKRVDDALGDSTMELDQLVKVCDLYLARWNPLDPLTKGKGKVRSELKRNKDGREQREFESLKEMVTANQKLTGAAKIIAECNVFIGRWKTSGHLPDVIAWRDEADKKSKRLSVIEEVRKDRDELRDRRRKEKDSEKAQIALCKKWLDDHAGDDYPLEAQNIIKGVRDELASLEAQLDDIAWRKVAKELRDNPGRYDKNIDLLNNYLSMRGANNRKVADQRLKEHRLRWDLSEYNKLSSNWEKVASPQDIRNLFKAVSTYLERRNDRLTEDYLDEPNPRSADGAIKKWKAWYQKVTSPGQRFVFDLRQIAVGSDIKGNDYTLNFRVNDGKRVSVPLFHQRRKNFKKDEKSVSWTSKKGGLLGTDRRLEVHFEENEIFKFKHTADVKVNLNKWIFQESPWKFHLTDEDGEQSVTVTVESNAATRVGYLPRID